MVIMSLRALARLLGRRFSPRGIPRARVLAQAETLGLALHRPLRPLHTSRDLDVGDGAIGALTAAGGIAALIGIMYSNGDEPSLEVTGKETANFVTDMKRPPIDDPAIRAKFMDEAGKVAWAEYLDYINFLMLHPEVTDKKVHDEMIQRRYVKTEELEGMSVDEPAMKARFEEWMKQFGRTYKNEEEKVMRYELFKACAIKCDKTNASTQTGARYAPNDLADWTDEEMYGPCYQEDDSYWEEYFNELSRMYAEGRIEGYPRTVDTDRKVGWADAAKQWYRILKARKPGLDAARKAEQAAATRKTKEGC